MPQQSHDKQIFSLYEVCKSIQRTIAERYKSTYWIKAEMNKLNYYSHSGHCYPELVEKIDGKTVAQIKASLWKDDYLRANRNFLSVLNEPLRDGIKILFLAKISFDPAYGLSLRIIEIDPAFTLGDLEKEKQEAISRLQEENIFNKNRSLSLPLLPKRIAVISVETSKGYADFVNVLQTNNYGYRFFHYLFPSLLQGEKAPEAMIAQLRKIEGLKMHFDAVAIIRGGGGDVGLSCYNNYELAREIALFPLPVLTGIGHATNETVAELVSYANAITPTKMAEFLLQHFHNFSVPVLKAEEKITERSKRILEEAKSKFTGEVKLLRSVTENILLINRSAISQKNLQLAGTAVRSLGTSEEKLQRSGERLSGGAAGYLKESRATLLSAEKNISNLDPRNILKRGFSISYANGQILKSIKDVKKGDMIKTILYDGAIESKADLINKKKNDGQD